MFPTLSYLFSNHNIDEQTFIQNDFFSCKNDFQYCISQLNTNCKSLQLTCQQRAFFIPWYSSLSLYFSFLFPPVCMSLPNKSFLRHDTVPLNTQEKRLCRDSVQRILKRLKWECFSKNIQCEWNCYRQKRGLYNKMLVVVLLCHKTELYDQINNKS